jgi:hypothetical protein
MELTINSKTMKQPVDFYRPGKGYIFVDLSGGGSCPGCLGSQICRNGKLIGDTIAYSGDDEATFARICRGWFRAYLRREF